MAKVTDFKWIGEVRLTRRQIVSLGLLADYSANIIKQLKEQFPHGMTDISEEALQEAFHEFRRLYLIDQDVYKKLAAIVQSVNSMTTEPSQHQELTE